MRMSPVAGVVVVVVVVVADNDDLRPKTRRARVTVPVARLQATLLKFVIIIVIVIIVPVFNDHSKRAAEEKIIRIAHRRILVVVEL